MKRNHYARKKRQLRGLAKRLNQLMIENRADLAWEREKIRGKIRLILGDLSAVFTKVDIKRVLGGLAFSVGILYSTGANAQTFQPAVENPFGLVATQDNAMPSFADLDGDGDMDLLVAEYYGVIQYYENTGTSSSPQFAAPVSNPFGITSTGPVAFPTLADIDDDGDMDMLIGEYYGTFSFFENTGSSTAPQFAAPVSNPFGLSSTYVFAIPDFADMDGDGDLDLIVGEYYGNMHYFENTGSKSSPAFTTPVSNPFGLTATYAIAAPSVGDMDNDGDLDLIVGESYGALQYFENTGSVTNPQFASAVQNPFGLQSVYSIATPAMVDLDDDGDMDILVGEYYGNLQYFKNDLINGVNNMAEVALKVYPNPVQDVLFVGTDSRIDRVEVFNLLGQSVGVYEKPDGQINVSNLNTGLYTVRIELSSGEYSINKLQKQ